MNRFLTASFALISAALCTPSIAWSEEPVIAPEAKAAAPLETGDSIPDVTVHDAEGEKVSLRSLVKDGPTVIVFFRGSWCPICTRHFQDLIKIHPEVVKLGARMIAISPDTVENSAANTKKLKTPFPLYSDSNVAAASSFGLAFRVDDATIKKYKGFGIDLEKASGHVHHALPVPAVYIVDGAGKVLYAHSNPDYTKRLDGATILKELNKVR
ncbi:MAG: AhpC/TSA family protein [Planctomycetales bacterium]|nr:AhpC/TSA family protein [Planctomycetales bacterium]